MGCRRATIPNVQLCLPGFGSPSYCTLQKAGCNRVCLLSWCWGSRVRRTPETLPSRSAATLSESQLRFLVTDPLARGPCAWHYPTGLSFRQTPPHACVSPPVWKATGGGHFLDKPRTLILPGRGYMGLHTPGRLRCQPQTSLKAVRGQVQSGTGEPRHTVTFWRT